MPADDVLSVLLRGTRLSRKQDHHESSSSSSASRFCVSTPVFQLPSRRKEARGKLHAASPEESAEPVDFFAVYDSSSSQTNERGVGRKAAKTGDSAPDAPSRRLSKGKRRTRNAFDTPQDGDESEEEDRLSGCDGKAQRARELTTTEAATLRRKNRIYVKAGAEVLVPPPFSSFSDSLSPRASEASTQAPHKKSQQGGKNAEERKRELEGLGSSGEGGKRASLGLPLWLQERLKGRSIEKPTPIQMQALPLLLGGQHLLATAPTGSGKTFAFLLPLITLLKRPGKEFARLLVVCPSRELAKQTQREFDSLAGARGFRCRLLDEQKQGTDQPLSQAKRVDAVATTPLRLVQFLRDGRVSLAQCRHLVLDEADKLLDLGFAPQLDEILAGCTFPRLQVCLFSATLPPEVLRLADSLLHNPVHISIGAPNAAATSIEQELLFCTNEEGKLLALRTLHLTGKFVPPVLIFVQSKERAKQLYCELVYDGIFVECIHADKTKKQRDDIVEAFRRGQIWVLICTDVMARGVDFKNVELVINYDFPQSAAVYIHRIGRTGRAGRQGRAITFYTTTDIPNLRSVVGVMQQTSTCEVPEWLQKMTKMTAKQKRDLQKRAPERKPILTTPATDVRKEKRRQQAIEASKAKKRRREAAEAGSE
nr:TPA: ATP-dependent RNA helicase, putative [Neospora caninum Liverpool]